MIKMTCRKNNLHNHYVKNFRQYQVPLRYRYHTKRKFSFQSFTREWVRAVAAVIMTTYQYLVTTNQQIGFFFGLKISQSGDITRLLIHQNLTMVQETVIDLDLKKVAKQLN